MDKKIPLSNYPNPQLKRDSFICLNGEWQLSIDKERFSHRFYPLRINVPFSVETKASGVNHRLCKGEFLHYKRKFVVDAAFAKKGRVILHFEAIDQIADIYLNGMKIFHHEGGYESFSVDCLEIQVGENELLVDVSDDVTNPVFPRGKQAKRSNGIWYTETSGIYGSVWLESVPKQCIGDLRITPIFDEKAVNIDVNFEGQIKNGSAIVYFGNKKVAEKEIDIHRKNFFIKLDSFWREWTPEYPNLYDVKIKVNDDEVLSYFGMRKFGTISYKGFNVFALNNKPYFLTGVLDQGYYKDSGLTAPSLEAMERDVSSMKAMGFNCIRKHIKIEPMLWYNVCDRLGMIVIQDMVNNGFPPKPLYVALAPFFNIHIDDVKNVKKLGNYLQSSQSMFLSCMEYTAKHLYNVTSLAIWTIFNEGWGQFKAKEVYEKLVSLDSSRLIDATSGWFDVGCGNFNSKHIYFRKLKMRNDHIRILSLSEFGGYSLKVEGHEYNKNSFGYKRFFSFDALNDAISRLYLKELRPLINEQGLSVAIFTQLSDVEHEDNGLLTFDRVITKVDTIMMKRLNDGLRFDNE